MRVDSRLTLVLALTLAAYAVAGTPGKLQPDPAAPCPQSGTKPHELCFEIPNDGIARAESSSDTFYAIILKTADRCTITEEEHLQGEVDGQPEPRGKAERQEEERQHDRPHPHERIEDEQEDQRERDGGQRGAEREIAPAQREAG